MFVLHKANHANPVSTRVDSRGLVSRMILLVCVIIGANLFVNSAFAQNFDSRAPQAILLDADTGTVLYAKEEDTQILKENI